MMQKYHKGDRENRKRKVHVNVIEQKRMKVHSLNRECAHIYKFRLYIYFAEALTRLLIWMSEYGRKIIICNKIVICHWRGWRKT